MASTVQSLVPTVLVAVLICKLGDGKRVSENINIQDLHSLTDVVLGPTSLSAGSAGKKNCGWKDWLTQPASCATVYFVNKFEKADITVDFIKIESGVGMANILGGLIVDGGRPKVKVTITNLTIANPITEKDYFKNPVMIRNKLVPLCKIGLVELDVMVDLPGKNIVVHSGRASNVFVNYIKPGFSGGFFGLFASKQGKLSNIELLIQKLTDQNGTDAKASLIEQDVVEEEEGEGDNENEAEEDKQEEQAEVDVDEHLQSAFINEKDQREAGHATNYGTAVTCLEERTKYEPKDMEGQGRTVEQSPEDCQKRCARVARCAHFTFWDKHAFSDAGCHLQDSYSTARFDLLAVAGPPSCPSGSIISKLTGGSLKSSAGSNSVKGSKKQWGMRLDKISLTEINMRYMRGKTFTKTLALGDIHWDDFSGKLDKYGKGLVVKKVMYLFLTTLMKTFLCASGRKLRKFCEGIFAASIAPVSTAIQGAKSVATATVSGVKAVSSASRSLSAGKRSKASRRSR